MKTSYPTAPAINLAKYLKTWFVVAGRTPSSENGHYNATETYAWNEDEGRIDIAYRANQDAFDGKEIGLRRKAWVVDTHARSRWKVRAHYVPFSAQYLILAVAIDYSWAVAGTANGKYLWVLGDTPVIDEITLAAALSEAKSLGYPVHDVERKPQEVREDRPWGWIPPAEYRNDPGAGFDTRR